MSYGARREKSFAEVMYDRPVEKLRQELSKTRPETTRILNLEHNGLSLSCRYAEEQNLLRAKTEYCMGVAVEYEYHYDEQGRLLKALRDGLLEEEYVYSPKGQRVYQRRSHWLTQLADGRLRYDEQGRLIQAGDLSYSYDAQGALARLSSPAGVTAFTYGADTGLDEVRLPAGQRIRYEYDKNNRINPLRKFKDRALAAEYVWSDELRLRAMLDFEHMLEYQFGYDQQGFLSRLRLAPLPISLQRPPEAGHDLWEDLARSKRQEELHHFLGGRIKEFICGCDQVGTVKIIKDLNNRALKSLTLDSFGNVLADSFPLLFMPVGFAGGLVDRDTGLIRFGWRDYDPLVGRFTAPDPAKDRRGDGDVYDYCVDNPLSRVDPSGLWTKETFDEARVNRDDIGRFASGGGGSSGQAARNSQPSGPVYYPEPPQGLPDEFGDADPGSLSQALENMEKLQDGDWRITETIVESLPQIYQDKAAASSSELDRYCYDKLAELLNKWLAGPPHELKDQWDYTNVEVLDWQTLEQSPVFKKKISELLDDGHLFNAKAKNDLMGNLAKYNVPGLEQNYLDYVKALAEENDGQATVDLQFGGSLTDFRQGYFQQIEQGKSEAFVDRRESITALLGRFSILAVPHNATLSYDKSTDQFTVNIKDIIMVLDDNFDFSGQGPHLGVFNLAQGTHQPDLAPNPIKNEVYVTNQMFRDYRQYTGQGQDMKVVAVSKPVAINKTLNFNAKDYGQ